MPEWVEIFGNKLMDAIPELMVAIVTGFIVLIVEYRTGWFADRTPSVIEAKERGEKVERVGKSIKPVIDTIGGILGGLVAITLVVFFFYSVVDDRNKTVLENPDDPNVIVGTLEDGDTLTFFDNDLIITLSEVSNSKFIDFIAHSAGHQNLTVVDADVGDSFIYQGRHNYQIILSSFSTIGFTKMTVDFTIIKLEDGELVITPTPDKVN